jgi:hypothetical protein
VSGQEGAAGTSEAPTIIRGASILLMIVGAVTVLFSLPVLLNPSSARCQLSRVYIEQANKDTKDWNNVDTGGQKARDVPCPDAVRLARQIPRDEKGTGKMNVPSESALSTQNTVAAVIGVGQAVSGFSVIRSLGRWARNAAIALTAVTVILKILEPLSFGVLLFVAYAFAFSAASREIWPKGEPRG